MSTFLDIVCYDSADPEMGNVKRLTKHDLQELVARVPKYKLDEESNSLAIKLPGVSCSAVLEGGGTLSCLLNHQIDTSQLLDALRELAAHFPGAVVQDEEGDVY